MGYEADAVEVGADDATPICAVGPAGAVIQVLDGPPVTLGGEHVEAGKGIQLSVEDGWQSVPGGMAFAQGIGEAPSPLVLHGRTVSGKAMVAYLKHNYATS